MDIDTARCKTWETLVCRCCGLPGHFARDCPQQFDVRHMTLDERDAWAMEMLAALDAVPTEASEEPEKTEETADAADF